MLPEVGDAVVVIDEVRVLSERLLFYVQALPGILHDYTSLALVGVLADSGTQRLLADANRVSREVKRFNDTFADVAGLIFGPALERTAVGAERASQEFVRFNDTLERATGLFTGWPENDAANAPARLILADVRETIDSSTQLAAAVDTTAASIERVFAQIDDTVQKVVAMIPEEIEDRADERRDLQHLMIDTAVAAEKVEGLLKEFDRILVAAGDREAPPAVIGIIDRVNQGASGWIEQGFVYGVILILVFMTSGVIAMLTYRFLQLKLFAVQ